MNVGLAPAVKWNRIGRAAIALGTVLGDDRPRRHGGENGAFNPFSLAEIYGIMGVEPRIGGLIQSRVMAKGCGCPGDNQHSAKTRRGRPYRRALS